MSGVRVLGVLGSPRKGKNTELLLRASLEAAAEDGAETELVSLSEYRILPCNGCNTCVRGEPCPLDSEDDMGRVTERLLEADAIILAAPSYFGSVPGLMKSFMDRTRPLKMSGHRLGGKVASALSVSGLRHGGGEKVIEAITHFALVHGMIVVGGCEDPLTIGQFGIGTLQGDAGWRGIKEDKIALSNARGVGRRVARIALAIKLGYERLNHGSQG
ncbi:MAG: flavodoxin family protein [Candidatus Bathyarchaeia archaeon]|nr:flavodoxin family protein [Candidatus Bathyarchaeota archaeon]